MLRAFESGCAVSGYILESPPNPRSAAQTPFRGHSSKLTDIPTVGFFLRAAPILLNSDEWCANGVPSSRSDRLRKVAKKFSWIVNEAKGKQLNRLIDVVERAYWCRRRSALASEHYVTATSLGVQCLAVRISIQSQCSSRRISASPWGTMNVSSGAGMGKYSPPYISCMGLSS